MNENEFNIDVETANQTLTDAAKRIHNAGDDYYEITTSDALINYLGLDDSPRDKSHDDVTLLAKSRHETLPVTHYLYRTPNHGWVHVRTTDKNAGEHRVRHFINHIGEVTFNGRGIDKDALLDRCETRGIEIDELHAETVDEWAQYEAEGVADYVDDAAAVVSDGGSLYLETHGRLYDTLRRELDYEFEAEKEWGVFRTEVSAVIDTRSPTRLTRDVCVEYVVDLDYEPPY